MKKLFKKKLLKLRRLRTKRGRDPDLAVLQKRNLVTRKRKTSKPYVLIEAGIFYSSPLPPLLSYNNSTAPPPLWPQQSQSPLATLYKNLSLLRSVPSSSTAFISPFPLSYPRFIPVQLFSFLLFLGCLMETALVLKASMSPRRKD